MSGQNANTILRISQVKEITTLGRSTIYLYMSQGTFPKQRKLGERAVGWHSSDIFRWVAERNFAN
jgi:prophage regulatory protein